MIHRLATSHLLLLTCLGGNLATAFQTQSARHASPVGRARNELAPRSSRSTPSAPQNIILNASNNPLSTEGKNDFATRSSEINDEELTKVIESNDLQKVVNYLQSHSSSIPSLSKTQLRSIFDAVEIATAETDDNTVNKRMIQDQTIQGAVEFRSLDRVRAQMTKLYQLLREEGTLNAFGAVARLPTSKLVKSSQSLQSTQLAGPIYPTGGSKIITPSLLEQITEMSMSNLTPRPTNLLLYGGAGLALVEGIVSLYFGINFNLLVVLTLMLALADQLIVSGAVFETALRMVLPEMKTRITKHEAGHFLCAYLLGCPVEGVVLSTWAAMQDGRFGGRSTKAVSAGTSYYDLDLSEQIAGIRPLTRESIDRYSIIVMGGIAAEAVEYGAADGGAGDEEALVRFLRSLNPRGGNAVRSWTPELIRNQARWGAMQAVLLLKEYKPCYDALVDALERGGDLGQCVVAIEEAAKREGLGWLRKPLGVVVEEGEYGKWIPIDEVDDKAIVGEVGSMNSTNGNGSSAIANSDAFTSADSTNGVPTYGEDPITQTEQFLKQYREAMEKKLQTIDEELKELDNNANK